MDSAAASNFSFEGSPNCDSDIYGNIVEGVWDDAIESEGANMNVRIWGNYLNRTFVHIATAAVTRGPCYIFRNVFGESRRTHADRTGVNMLKVGDGRRREIDGREIELPAGRRFVFHNSALQPNGALHGLAEVARPTRSRATTSFGAAETPILASDDEAGNDFRTISRDTPLICPRTIWSSTWLPLSCSDGAETTIVRQDREISITDMVVTVPNPGVDTGVRLPGFNDDFQGEAPDMGAFERGNPPLAVRPQGHARRACAVGVT